MIDHCVGEIDVFSYQQIIRAISLCSFIPELFTLADFLASLSDHDVVLTAKFDCCKLMPVFLYNVAELLL